MVGFIAGCLIGLWLVAMVFHVWGCYDMLVEIRGILYDILRKKTPL